MHISLGHIEQESDKNSILHRVDGRIKLIIALGIIIYAVYTTNLLILFIMEIYLIILVLLSRISISYAIKRILLILPFGGLIAIFQPFIRPGAILYTLPFGIEMTYQGTMFALLLFSRLFVCITAIVLLSSITPMQEMINSARRLGMPREFSMILSLMIRYLFMFYDELSRIKNAQKSRCFNLWNKKTSYMWRLKQIGYTIMMLFLRSYEQGERVYLSMLSRGYSADSDLYNEKKGLSLGDFVFVLSAIFLMACLEITL